MSKDKILNHMEKLCKKEENGILFSHTLDQLYSYASSHSNDAHMSESMLTIITKILESGGNK